MPSSSTSAASFLESDNIKLVWQGNILSNTVQNARLDQEKLLVLDLLMTHRLWCLALFRSVRSVCAPGCHSVQQRAQEDPAESRQTDHRVEVAGHFWQSALSDFYFSPARSLLTASFEKTQQNVTGGLLAHMCRSAGGPFRHLAIPVALRGSLQFFPLKLFSCLSPSARCSREAVAENSLESFRGALRKFGASWLGEREVGRFE